MAFARPQLDPQPFYGPGTQSGSPKTVTQMENEAKKRTETQEKEIRGLLDQIIQMYQPGGGFGKGTEAMLTRQKEKDLSSATQSLISSGLFGSTMTAGLPKKWEEEVGMPTRTKLEDIRYGALGQALGQKANFIEGIENMYPDYGMVAQLQSQASSAPSKASMGLDAFGSPLGSKFPSIAPTGGVTQSYLDAIKQQEEYTKKNAAAKPVIGIAPVNKNSKSTPRLAY